MGRGLSWAASMAVLHEAQQGRIQVGPQGILVLPSVQHSQEPPEEVQRCCWDLPSCRLERLSSREQQRTHTMQRSVRRQEDQRAKHGYSECCWGKRKPPSSLRPNTLFASQLLHRSEKQTTACARHVQQGEAWESPGIQPVFWQMGGQ